MSLINEALKKAQKQRTGDAPSLNEMPALGGQSASSIARRGQSGGPTALIIRIAAGLGAVAVVVVVTVIFMRRSPAESTAPAKPAPGAQSAPVQAAPVVPTPAPNPVEVAPQPVVQTPVVQVPVVQAPVATPPQQQNPVPVVTVPQVQPKPEPVQPRVEAPVQVASAPVATAPVITIPAAPARTLAPGKLEPRAITYIESIRVAGIRASGSDRKVLMNDRVYRIGDLVEPEMGLTLTGIATNALTFEDEKGGKYTRNF